MRSRAPLPKEVAVVMPKPKSTKGRPGRARRAYSAQDDDESSDTEHDEKTRMRRKR